MIEYRTGDATIPVERPVVIAHVVNDEGGWGAGFVVPLGRRYPAAERAYRREVPSLGAVQWVEVEPGAVWVANLCAQRGFATRERPCALDYDALAKCLAALVHVAAGATVQMPRIGCGLAGGEWSRVEALIEAAGLAKVVVLDLPEVSR